MRIYGSGVSAGLAVLLALTLVMPGPGQGQTASYLDHDGLTRELRSLVNSSDLATMESMGTTLGGRDVWMVTGWELLRSTPWMSVLGSWWSGTWKGTTWWEATWLWRPSGI